MEIFLEEPNQRPDERTTRKTRKSIEEILAGPEPNDGSRPPRPTPVFGAPEWPSEEPEPTTNSTAFGRIVNETAEGVAKIIRRNREPIGLTPEQIADLRQRGIFHSEEGDPRLPQVVNQMLTGARALNEALLRPSVTLKDVGLLGLQAGLEGVRQGGSQALKELGFSFLNPDLLMRDVVGMIQRRIHKMR